MTNFVASVDVQWQNISERVATVPETVSSWCISRVDELMVRAKHFRLVRRTISLPRITPRLETKQEMYTRFSENQVPFACATDITNTGAGTGDLKFIVDPPSVVPEPAALVLCGAGVALLAAGRRQRAFGYSPGMPC